MQGYLQPAGKVYQPEELRAPEAPRQYGGGPQFVKKALLQRSGAHRRRITFDAT